MSTSASHGFSLTDEVMAVLDLLPVPVAAGSAIRDADGRVVEVRTDYVNPAARRAIAVPSSGLAEPEVVERLASVIESGEPVAHAGRWPRGHGRDEGIVLTEAVPFGDGYLGVFRDVTDSVRAEAEVRAGEARLAEAQRIAELGVWEWEIAGGKVHWSDELYRIYGISRSEYRPSYEGYLMRVHPEDRDRVAAVIAQAAVDGEPFAFQERIVRPDGEVRILRSGGRVTRDAAGRPTNMLGVCHDVTEQVTAQEQLLAARADLERRRFAERQAAQINDGIIDGLVRAVQALDEGDQKAVREAMHRTLEQAGRMVTELRASPGRSSGRMV